MTTSYPDSLITYEKLKIETILHIYAIQNITFKFSDSNDIFSALQGPC